jgi:hypothetical protein
MRALGEKTSGVQDRLTWLAAIAPSPLLVSVEVPWSASQSRGARARFGVKPPPPLSAMPRGDIGISDPVILEVPADVAELPNIADSAVALMRGSTRLAAGTASMGVYWETYGIAAGDSIEVSVAVQRRGGGGSPVITSWREPQPGQAVRTVSGTVPIQMRSLVLDISGLPVGPYALELSVRRGAQAARSTRDFVVQ